MPQGKDLEKQIIVLKKGQFTLMERKVFVNLDIAGVVFF